MAIVDDLRSAARELLRRRRFTLATALILGCGLGATALVFALLDHLLLRPLPFAEAERLVMAWRSRVDGGEEKGLLQPDQFAQFRESVRSFSAIEVFVAGPDVGLDIGLDAAHGGTGAPERVAAAAVSPGFFAALGVQPLLGRTFLPGQASGEPVVVLSHRLWERRFGKDRRLIGRTLRLSDRSWTVVGVMPPGFDFPGVDLWVPDPLAAGQAMNLPLPVTFGFRVLARLAPGVELRAARAEVVAVGRRLAALEGRGDVTFRTVSLRDELVGDQRPLLLILAVAVTVLLLVTCANTANLLLVQLVARQRELAVKSALGATRGRLVRQLLAEGLLLSLLAAGVGLGVAAVGLRLLAALPLAQAPAGAALVIDDRVLLFLVLVAMASGLLLAAGPAMRSARTDVATTLRGFGGGATRRGGPLRVLVVAEIALTLVLLVGAALLVRSVLALVRHDLGFEPANVLTGKLVLTGAGHATAGAQAAFLEAVVREVERLPEVRRAAVSNSLPFEEGGLHLPLAAEGSASADPADWPAADCVMVSPGYFDTLGIRLTRGRFLSRRDREGAPPVLVLDAGIARQLFGSRDPIGRRVQVFGTWREVVGVAGDVDMQGFREPARPLAYLPTGQFRLPWPFYYLLVKTRGSPLHALAGVRAAIARVDPDQPLSAVTTLAEQVAHATWRERAVAFLLVVFGAFCLALAVVGTYAVLTFSLQQRTREIGIRAALGASRAAQLGLVLRQAAQLAALGALAGLTTALIATRLLSSLLYGVGRADPVSFLVPTALVAVVTLSVALIPARRLLRLDVARVLRAEG